MQSYYATITITTHLLQTYFISKRERHFSEWWQFLYHWSSMLTSMPTTEVHSACRKWKSRFAIKLVIPLIIPVLFLISVCCRNYIQQISHTHNYALQKNPLKLYLASLDWWSLLVFPSILSLFSTFLFSAAIINFIFVDMHYFISVWLCELFSWGALRNILSYISTFTTFLLTVFLQKNYLCPPLSFSWCTTENFLHH